MAQESPLAAPWWFERQGSKSLVLLRRWAVLSKRSAVQDAFDCGVAPAVGVAWDSFVVKLAGDLTESESVLVHLDDSANDGLLVGLLDHASRVVRIVPAT